MSNILDRIITIRKDFLENGQREEILVITLWPKEVAMLFDEMGIMWSDYNNLKALLSGMISEFQFGTAKIRMFKGIEKIVSL